MGYHSAANIAGSVVTANALAGVVVGDVSFANFFSDSITGNMNVDVACAPQFSATRGALTEIEKIEEYTNCVEP